MPADEEARVAADMTRFLSGDPAQLLGSHAQAVRVCEQLFRSELRAVAETRGPVCAREPWRLGAGYARTARVDVAPRRDSPLWVMSVNRANWPDYQKMMTGTAHTLAFEPNDVYPPPLVPPVELEILYDKVPLDHSWGARADRAPAAPKPKPPAASKRTGRRRRKRRVEG